MGWVWTPDGKRIWEGDGQPPGDNDGGTTGGTTGGGTGTGTKTATKAERIRVEWASLFPYGSKVPGIPKALVNWCIKYGYSDSKHMLDWTRRNAKGIYGDTAVAAARRMQARQYLDIVFGENQKITDAYLKAFTYADPRTWNIEKFLEQKVTKSKLFKKEYPYWGKFQKENEHMSVTELLNKWRQGEEQYKSYYQEVMGAGAKMPRDIMNRAIAESWTAETFKTYVAQHDPNYVTSGTAVSRKDMITNLWHQMYGADSEPDEAIVEGFVRGAEQLEAYFNRVIRTSQKFKDANPMFEDWAAGQYGTEGSGMPADPMEYFQQMKEWRQYYEVLAEKPGATNEELIAKAMKGGWSQARFELEFMKTDPNYQGTSTAGNKSRAFDKYWQNMFGTDSVPNPDIKKEFMGMTTPDPSVMFDKVKETTEFKQQYGNWEDFAKAQSEKGIGGEIVDNPASYKQYQDMFTSAFARLGVKMTDEMRGMIFKSGMEEKDIEDGLNTWTYMSASQQWKTGQEVKPEEVLGLTDKTAGGDLRQRMAKAFAQHKEFASSKFNQWDTTQQGETLIRKI